MTGFYCFGLMAAAVTAEAATSNTTETLTLEVTKTPAEIKIPYNGAPVILDMNTVFGFKGYNGTIVRLEMAKGVFATSGNNTTLNIVPTGNVDIELSNTVAPKTCTNFMEYVSGGNYGQGFSGYGEGLIHRSVPGFIIQGGNLRLSRNSGGGFTGAYESVPTFAPVPSEFKMSNVRGTIAMALPSTNGVANITQATSQWFINLVDNSGSLDPQKFTVFGNVIGNGMSVADAVANDTIVYMDSPLATPNEGIQIQTQIPLANYTGGDGTITEITPAGNATAMLMSVDNNPRGQCFPNPEGLAFDSGGNLFILGSPNSEDGQIWEIEPGGANGEFTNGLVAPNGLVLDGNFEDGSGPMFVTDSGITSQGPNNSTITGGVIQIFDEGVLGVQGGLFAVDANMTDPQGIVLASSGNLFVANFDNGSNGTIFEIDPNGNVTPFVTGLPSPVGLAIDGDDNLYVSSFNNGTISKITPQGNVSLFASGFNEPRALAMDGNNDLFVANYGNGTISKITPEGVVSIYAKAKTKNPQGLTVDSGGNVYVSNGLAVEFTNPSLAVATNALGDFQYVVAGQPLEEFFATGLPTGVLTLSSTYDEPINNHISLAPMKNKAGKIQVTLYAFNLQGKAVSTKVTVVVGVPNITTQPKASNVVAKGGSLTLSIKAAVPPQITTKYQWLLNGKMLRNSTNPKLTVVSGVTTNTLKLSKVQAAAAGSYTVQVTNLLGTTTSNAAKVTVSGS